METPALPGGDSALASTDRVSGAIGSERMPGFALRTNAAERGDATRGLGGSDLSTTLDGFSVAVKSDSLDFSEIEEIGGGVGAASGSAVYAI